MLSEDDVLNLAVARRELDDAALVLGGAIGTAHALAADTTWQAKGVRVLRERMRMLADDVACESARALSLAGSLGSLR